MPRLPFPPSDADALQGTELQDTELQGTDLQAALVASGVVGVWTHDVWADRFALSAPLAQRLGLDPAEGVGGVPLAAFLAGTHEADRDRVENVIHAAFARSGAFEVAFRTARGPCWLALRGRIDRAEAGQPACGRGIALDLTEDGAARDGQHTVNRMAEHAIAMRGLVGGLRRPGLTRLLDSLMIEIGFELARHLQDAPDGRRH